MIFTFSKTMLKSCVLFFVTLIGTGKIHSNIFLSLTNAYEAAGDLHSVVVVKSLKKYR